MIARCRYQTLVSFLIVVDTSIMSGQKSSLASVMVSCNTKTMIRKRRNDVNKCYEYLMGMLNDKIDVGVSLLKLLLSNYFYCVII